MRFFHVKIIFNSFCLKHFLLFVCLYIVNYFLFLLSGESENFISLETFPPSLLSSLSLSFPSSFRGKNFSSTFFSLVVRVLKIKLKKGRLTGEKVYFIFTQELHIKEMQTKRMVNLRAPVAFYQKLINCGEVSRQRIGVCDFWGVIICEKVNILRETNGR